MLNNKYELQIYILVYLYNFLQGGKNQSLRLNFIPLNIFKHGLWTDYKQQFKKKQKLLTAIKTFLREEEWRFQTI